MLLSRVFLASLAPVTCLAGPLQNNSIPAPARIIVVDEHTFPTQVTCIISRNGKAFRHKNTAPVSRAEMIAWIKGPQLKRPVVGEFQTVIVHRRVINAPDAVDVILEVAYTEARTFYRDGQVKTITTTYSFARVYTSLVGSPLPS